MNRPPLKAFEAVKRYCKSNATCNGCPLRREEDEYYVDCYKRPCYWELAKGDKK